MSADNCWNVSKQMKLVTLTEADREFKISMETDPRLMQNLGESGQLNRLRKHSREPWQKLLQAHVGHSRSFSISKLLVLFRYGKKIGEVTYDYCGRLLHCNHWQHYNKKESDSIT